MLIATTVFRKDAAVCWNETAFGGEKIVQCGKVLGKEGHSYRVVTEDGWRMLVHADSLSNNVDTCQK